MANTPVVVLDDTMTSIANAIRAKTGGTATMTPSEMPTEIASIPSGGGGEGLPREVSSTGVYGHPTQQFTFSLPSEATDVGAYAVYYGFFNCATLTDVDFSSLTSATGFSGLRYAFQNCTNLLSVDFSSLETVSGEYCFGEFCKDCTSLATIDFSSLTSIAANQAFVNAFRGCSSLTSVDLSSLTTISVQYGLSDTFRSCSSLTSVDLSSLSSIKANYCMQSVFRGCTSLTSLSFPALTTTSFGSYTNQFNGMLSGCSNVTVHFPASIQSTIGSWSDVTSGFGGTNTTVSFDL